MNRLFIAFAAFLKKRLIGNVIPAVVILLFWFYGLQASMEDSIGTAMVAFILLSIGDMVSLYFFENSAKHKKHVG